MNKVVSLSFNLSLLFGAIAAFLCAGITYSRIFMIASLLSGFFGFGFCCLHIVVGQREENNIKPASTPMVLLSLFLNSTPLLCVVLLIWLAKHGS